MIRGLSILLLVLSVALAFGRGPAGNATVVRPVLELVGQTILSGTQTSALKTNGAAIYWQTNTASGGTLPIYSLLPAPLSWSNLSPDIASFDGATVTALGNGRVRMVLSYGLGDSLFSVEVNKLVASATEAGTNYVFVTNTAASLANHFRTNFFARKTGDATARRALFTSASATSTNYVRNTNFFMADVAGIEAYPAHSSVIGSMRPVLVSPRHILSVAHIGGHLGALLHFVNRTNDTALVRSVVAVSRLSVDSDLSVGVLNLPLPGSFVPAAVFTNAARLMTNADAGGADYLPALGVFPFAAFNQDSSPAINSGFSVLPTFNSGGATGDGWSQTIRGGDSGSPALGIINGRAVVFTVWTVAGGGVSVPAFVPEIQTVMNSLCAARGYTNEALSVVSTAGFTLF